MTKIGILTYHNTTNYGALLQAFALESKLRELGADAEIINYHCKNIEAREYVTFPKFNSNIISYLKNIKRYYKVSKKRKIIKNFIQQNVILSKCSYDRNTIKESNKIYDKFIVGSDMVFELGINGGDMSFYLDFAEPKKRYSYAASLGVSKINDKYLDKCVQELEKFEHISIREEQGQKYFSSILKNEVYQDIDPTLLYDKSFWEKYEEIPKNISNKNYILLYFVDPSMPEFDIACKMAKEKNLEVYILSNGKYTVNGCKVIYDASIGEFLYYIHNASLVITASFHGMIFSINYNTNFMFFTHNNSSSRLKNLAELTGTSDREIKDSYIPKFECKFDNINKCAEEIRNKSINYLKTLVEK